MIKETCSCYLVWNSKALQICVSFTTASYPNHKLNWYNSCTTLQSCFKIKTSTGLSLNKRVRQMQCWSSFWVHSSSDHVKARNCKTCNIADSWQISQVRQCKPNWIFFTMDWARTSAYHINYRALNSLISDLWQAVFKAVKGRKCRNLHFCSKRHSGSGQELCFRWCYPEKPVDKCNFACDVEYPGNKRCSLAMYSGCIDFCPSSAPGEEFK